MLHSVLESALNARGAHPILIFNILRELTQIQARMVLPGCDPTELFDFLRGGKQGGVDTPDLFNVVIEFLIGDLVTSWNLRQFGTTLKELGERVHHLIWCDNIWIISDKKSDLEIMISELTVAIHKGGFRWKPSSLKIMGGGDAIHDDLSGISSADVDGERLIFQYVSNMLILGNT